MNVIDHFTCIHEPDECFSCKHWDTCERPAKQTGNPLWVIVPMLCLWALLAIYIWGKI